MRPISKSLLFLSFLIFSFLLLTGAEALPPQAASAQQAADLWQAYLEQTSQHFQVEDPLAGIFTPELDSAFISSDGQVAILWLALSDNQGNKLGTEPGLLLAELTADGWQLAFPGEPAYERLLNSLPTDAIPAELSPAPGGAQPAAETEVLTGYYLPWVKGRQFRLEGSILHFQNYPALGYPSCTVEFCRHAYDFTFTTHFPLVASKAGTVVAAHDGCNDGNPACTNYIVLKEGTSGPFQLYLHLANGTIPDHLVNGTFVPRGAYLGDTDDTGYSTSEHVHFMVVDDWWWGNGGYPWGRSQNIRFADVTLNGGIPRTCVEVTQFPIFDDATQCNGYRSDPTNPANDWFTSGNVGANPPTGSLVRPLAGETVAVGDNALMDVTAHVQDDVRVTRAVLMAKVDGAWQEIGPRPFTQLSPGVFDWDVNLCEVGPLNGPLDIALRIWDHEGNRVDMLSPHTINVDYACPSPKSQMTQPATYDGTAVLLRWEETQSWHPIQSYQLQWREGDAPWSDTRMLNFAGDKSEGWFVGNAGSTYAFRLRAVDLYGQMESWPANDAAEVTVSLPAACLPDLAEEDDAFGTSSLVSPGLPLARNICAAGDLDFFKFTPGGSGYHRFFFKSLDAGAAGFLRLYAADEVTLLAEASSHDLGRDVVLISKLTAGQVYYVRVEPLHAALSGTAVRYAFTVDDVNLNFLPLLQR